MIDRKWRLKIEISTAFPKLFSSLLLSSPLLPPLPFLTRSQSISLLSALMSEPSPSEEAPVASSSSSAPVIKIKFGVDPNLILNEPRKRPREVVYNAKAAAHAKQDVYEEPAYVLDKGGKLIQAIKDAREDEYTE